MAVAGIHTHTHTHARDDVLVGQRMAYIDRTSGRYLRKSAVGPLLIGRPLKVLISRTDPAIKSLCKRATYSTYDRDFSLNV